MRSIPDPPEYHMTTYVYETDKPPVLQRKFDAPTQPVAPPTTWIDVEVTLTRRLRIAQGTEQKVMDTLGMSVANAGGYPAHWPMYSFQTPTDLSPVAASLRPIDLSGQVELSGSAEAVELLHGFDVDAAAFIRGQEAMRNRAAKIDPYDLHLAGDPIARTISTPRSIIDIMQAAIQALPLEKDRTP